MCFSQCYAKQKINLVCPNARLDDDYKQQKTSHRIMKCRIFIKTIRFLDDIFGVIVISFFSAILGITSWLALHHFQYLKLRWEILVVTIPPLQSRCHTMAAGAQFLLFVPQLFKSSRSIVFHFFFLHIASDSCCCSGFCFRMNWFLGDHTSNNSDFSNAWHKFIKFG